MEKPNDAVGPTPPVVANAAAPSVSSDVDGTIEFRTLIVLLTLATAINNNGHAILKQVYGEDYRAPLELMRRSSKLEKRLLLNAFAVSLYGTTRLLPLRPPNKLSMLRCHLRVTRHLVFTKSL
jgi:hypothetical protein